MCPVTELKNLVSLIKLSQPDLMVVSIEGMKFPTWRLLLALHSPMLADLLVHTLIPADQSLVAITLPLNYTSVSSLLATLGEGGGLDYLGEAAQVLGSKVIFSVTALLPKEGRIHNVEITDKNSDSFHKLMSSAISSRHDLGIITKEMEYFDTAKGTSSENMTLGSVDIESESKYFGADMCPDTTPEMAETEQDNDKILDNLEDSLKKTGVDSKQREEGEDNSWPYIVSIAPGKVFPNYDSMMTSINEWSLTNFSPLATINSSKRRHNFICPHRFKSFFLAVSTIIFAHTGEFKSS